jgi:hypothetical protein
MFLLQLLSFIFFSSFFLLLKETINKYLKITKGQAKPHKFKSPSFSPKYLKREFFGMIF